MSVDFAPLDPNADESTPLAPEASYYATEKVSLSAEQVAELWRRLDAGLKYREKVFLPTYRAANLLWQGQHWPEDRFDSPAAAHLVLNIIPNTVKSLVESVAYQHPDFTIVPRNEKGEATQTIIKSALDYWWNQSHVSEQLKYCAYDARLYGVGFVQTGWLQVEEDGVTLEDGRREVLPSAMPASGAVLAEAHGLLAPGETAQDFVHEDDLIEDRFLARRVNPVDMIVPAAATAVVDDWPWVAKIVRRPLSELRQDPRFRRGRGTKTILGLKDLTGTTDLSEPYEAYAAYLPDDIQRLDEGARPPDVRYVETIELWERDRRLHVILCREDRHRYLLAEKWTHQTNRYPFRTLHGTHTPDEFYGKSVPVELWHVQIELNVTRSTNLEHARQFNRMYQAPEDSLSNQATTNLQAGEAGTVVFYKHGPWGNNPIAPIPHLQLQPEIYRAYQWALQGAEQLSGLSQYELASPPAKRLTNDEVQAIQNHGKILFMADAAGFSRLAKEVAEDLLAYCEQFDTLIEHLGVYDQDQDLTLWSHFSGSEIRGNTMVEVDPESTAPPDAQSELQTQKMVLDILLKASELTAQLGGQLPRALAVTMREMLRIAGARNINALLPLPPKAPPPGPANLPPGAHAVGGALQQAQGAPGGAPGAPPPPGPPPGPPGPPPGPPAGPPHPAFGPQGLQPDQVQQLLNSLSPDELAQLGAFLQGTPQHG